MNLNNKSVKFAPSSVELGHFFSQKEYFFFYSKSLCQKGFKVCNFLFFRYSYCSRRDAPIFNI